MPLAVKAGEGDARRVAHRLIEGHRQPRQKRDAILLTRPVGPAPSSAGVQRRADRVTPQHRLRPEEEAASTTNVRASDAMRIFSR
jgi:hypothetical protein